MALLIALGTANAFVAATSRLGYALSRDGVFPRPLAGLDTNAVPRTSVLVVGGWALLCLVISYLASWDAETLLVVPDSLVIIVYLSATVAAIRLFRGPRRWIAGLATLMSCALVPFAGVVLVIPPSSRSSRCSTGTGTAGSRNPTRHTRRCHDRLRTAASGEALAGIDHHERGA
jgi:amino acid efflux transporter